MRVHTIGKFFALALLTCAVAATPALAATPATAAPANPLAVVVREGGGHGGHDGDHSGGKNNGGRTGRGPQASANADNRRTDGQNRNSGSTQGRRVDEQTVDSDTTDNRRGSDRDQPAGAGEAPWDNGHSDDAESLSRVPLYRGR
ncbi:hypothetical protein ACFVUS_26985 [Nocardia sp. NPDC058058]|uniref:hypothetical protein n=1 Tax=Nocardia sp. NPDC058058 TaxID=3346317 RepID=UPI0036DBDE42